MNSRQRVFETLKQKKLADRVPWTFNFGATQGFNPSLLAGYKRHRGVRGPICEYFDYDVYMVLDPDRIRPVQPEADGVKVGLEAIVGGIKLTANGIRREQFFDLSKLPERGYLDPWGIYHAPWPTDPTFEVYHAPLQRISDLRRIREYPSPGIDRQSVEEARSDVGLIRSLNKASACYSGSIFEWSWNIRGQERFFLDIYDQPEAIELIVDKISDFVRELALTLLDIGVDILAFYDDFGQQDRLQIGADSWRQLIKPGWKKVWSAVKERNADSIIFLHSCGHIREVIADLVELGVDVLHPIQPETMNVYEVADEFRGDLAIWGTISSQQTIPLGSPEDVREEIRERVDRIGRHGGFIVSPSNIMGPEIPYENIDSFQQACRTFCGGS